MKNREEKNEEQAISIMAFLVENWRKAVSRKGESEPIMGALQGYLDALKKYRGISDREIDILYLKAKIRATEEQVKEYKEKSKKIKIKKGEKNE